MQQNIAKKCRPVRQEEQTLGCLATTSQTHVHRDASLLLPELTKHTHTRLCIYHNYAH